MQDLWSLGVVLYFMIFREYPFKNKNNILEDIRQACTPTFDVKKTCDAKKWKHVSAETLEVFNRIFIVDWKKRINFVELLEQPLFNKYSKSNDFVETLQQYKMIESEYAQDESSTIIQQQMKEIENIQLIIEEDKLDIQEVANEDDAINDDESLGICKIYSMNFQSQQQVQAGIKNFTENYELQGKGPRLKCEGIILYSQATYESEEADFSGQIGSLDNLDFNKSELLPKKFDDPRAPPNSVGVSALFNKNVQCAMIYNIESNVIQAAPGESIGGGL